MAGAELLYRLGIVLDSAVFRDRLSYLDGCERDM